MRFTFFQWASAARAVGYIEVAMSSLSDFCLAGCSWIQMNHMGILHKLVWNGMNMKNKQSQIYKFMTRARDPIPSPRKETLHFHHLHCRYCATVPRRLHIGLCKGHWRQHALHSSGRLCCGEVAPGHHDTIDMIITSLPMFPGDDLKSHGFVYQVKVISNIKHSSKIGKKHTVNHLIYFNCFCLSIHRWGRLHSSVHCMYLPCKSIYESTRDYTTNGSIAYFHNAGILFAKMWSAASCEYHDSWTNPRVPWMSVKAANKSDGPPIVCPGQVLHVLVLERIGGIPWSSVNPDTKLLNVKFKKKNVHTMSSRFLTLVSWAQKSWDHPIIGLKSCPPPQKESHGDWFGVSL